MATKKTDSTSEVTIVMQVRLTSIIKTPSDEEKAMKQTDAEAKRIEKLLNKLSGVDNIDIQKVKVFPNVKG